MKRTISKEQKSDQKPNQKEDSKVASGVQIEGAAEIVTEELAPLPDYGAYVMMLLLSSLPDPLFSSDSRLLMPTPAQLLSPCSHPQSQLANSLGNIAVPLRSGPREFPISPALV